MLDEKSSGSSYDGLQTGHATLHKRLPPNVNFDASVSAADKHTIRRGLEEMVILARAAAQANYATGGVDDIYSKYFPQGHAEKIQALFKYLAGIPQQWGGKIHNAPNWDLIIFARKRGPQNEEHGSKSLADTDLVNGGQYRITIYDIGMPPRYKTLETRNGNDIGPRTSVKMEVFGGLLMHEVM